jgi:hypothetical protein
MLGQKQQAGHGCTILGRVHTTDITQGDVYNIRYYEHRQRESHIQYAYSNSLYDSTIGQAARQLSGLIITQHKE